MDELSGTVLGQAGGHIGDRAGWIPERVDGEESAIERLLEPEESAQRRIVHIDDAQVAAAQQLRDVATEVDRRAVREDAMPAHPDAKPFPRAAVSTVTRHEITGVHGLFITGIAMTQDRGDTLGALREVDDIGRKAQVGTTR